MAQLNLNTKMRKAGNEAFMLWTVDPSKVDMVTVITEGMAMVALDIKMAMAINLQ